MIRPGQTAVVSLGEIDVQSVCVRDLSASERSEEAIETYADAYARGEELPPLTVFAVDGRLVLADGYHRYHARARLAERTKKRATALVRCHEGDLTAATRYALNANDHHGMRWSPDDCRVRVFVALESGMWEGESSRQIARDLRLSPTTVSKYRDEWERLNARDTGPSSAPTVHVDTPDGQREAQSSRNVGSAGTEDEDPEGTPEPAITDGEALPFETDPEPDAVDRLIEQTDERAAELERVIRAAQRLARKLSKDKACPLASTANQLAGDLRDMAGRPGQCRIARHTDCDGAGCGRCSHRGWVLMRSVKRAERRAG